MPVNYCFSKALAPGCTNIILCAQHAGRTILAVMAALVSPMAKPGRTSCFSFRLGDGNHPVYRQRRIERHAQPRGRDGYPQQGPVSTGINSGIFLPPLQPGNSYCKGDCKTKQPYLQGYRKPFLNHFQYRPVL